MDALSFLDMLLINKSLFYMNMDILKQCSSLLFLSVVYWLTHLPNKQKICGSIQGEDTDSFGLVSGNMQSYLLWQLLENKGAIV